MAKRKSKKLDSNSRLREFYLLGERVRQADKQSDKDREQWKYHVGVHKNLKAKLGISSDQIIKARKFAERYSQADLNELCDLGSDGGAPITLTHIVVLLRVPKDTAMELARKASREKWSSEMLSAEVRAMYPEKGSGGGRHTQPPPTKQAALVYTRKLAVRWASWCDALRRPSGRANGCGESASLGSLPPAIWPDVEKTETLMRGLVDKIERSLKEIKSTQEAEKISKKHAKKASGTTSQKRSGRRSRPRK